MFVLKNKNRVLNLASKVGMSWCTVYTTMGRHPTDSYYSTTNFDRLFYLQASMIICRSCYPTNEVILSQLDGFQEHFMLVHAVKSIFSMALNKTKTSFENDNVLDLDNDISGIWTCRLDFLRFVMAIINAGKVTGNQLTGLGSDMDIINI